MKTSNITIGAVLYCRVSTGEQAEHGTSLDSQRAACRQKALALNLPIVAEREDAGISGGFLVARPGIQAALADITTGRANTLICANLTRFSRDLEHQQAILKEVKAAGGRVVFCDMHFDDTPEGDLAFGIMGTFAQYERQVIRARTMTGKRKRAEEGQQPQRSRSPYGYHIVTRADILRGLYPAEMLGRYTIDDPKADIARRLFHEYASGMNSLPKLALALNTEGIPPPGPAQGWHEGTIRVILRNPVYKGKPVSGKTHAITDESRLGQPNALTGRPLTTMQVRQAVSPDKWIHLSAPPLVTEDIWDTVQARFAVMNARYGGNPKQTRMLSGLTACPFCGGPAITRYQTANGKPYRYFVCSASRKARWQGTGPVCHSDVYPMLTVEEAALTALREAYSRPEAISEAVRVYRQREQCIKDSVSNTQQKIVVLEKALSRLDAEEQATVQAQVAGMMAGASANAYTALFAHIAARRTELEARRNHLTVQEAHRPQSAPGNTEPDIAQRVLADAWRVLTDPEVTGAKKRQIIGTVVQKVICGKEGAKVVFVPGLFGEITGHDEASRRTCYTTCIGINTQR